VVGGLFGSSGSDGIPTWIPDRGGAKGRGEFVDRKRQFLLDARIGGVALVVRTAFFAIVPSLEWKMCHSTFGRHSRT